MMMIVSINPLNRYCQTQQMNDSRYLSSPVRHIVHFTHGANRYILTCQQQAFCEICRYMLLERKNYWWFACYSIFCKIICKS